MRPLVLAALLLAAAAGATDGPPDARRRASKTPDHSGQWMDPPKRDQSNIGSCHAFAAVAILEAAYSRGHGHRLRLSEEDLYVQRTILTGDAHADVCRPGLKCGLMEGNFVEGDVRHVLEKGILTGSQYAEFVKRYRVYRQAEINTRKAMARARAEKGATDFAFDDDPETSWTEKFSDPAFRKEVERSLIRTDDRVDSERAQMKELFKDARLVRKDFPDFDDLKANAAECRIAGADARAAIVGELDAGRPVGVSMHLTGLKSWGSQTDKHAWHAFVISGYEPGKTGLRFKVRNSWGGVNPDVLESQLCRIGSVENVLWPSETETF